MKLKVEDIKKQNPSERLSALINAKFEKIEDFAAAIKRSVPTARKYLREPAKVPQKIRTQISQMLGKEYDEIIISADEQITRWVDEVTENISQYGALSDLDTLSELRTLCLEKRNKIEMGKMYRNVGMCYYYNNKPVPASVVLEEAIYILSAEKAFDLVLKYKSELCLVYYYKHSYKKAEELFENVELLINEFKCTDSKTVFLHNYRWGILYINTERTNLARTKLEKARTYAKSKFEIGHATMNIGFSYMKDKQFTKALKYYEETLDIYDSEDYLSRSVVYNNIAELYKENHKLAKALEHINMALELLAGRNKSKLFIFSATYIQIKILQGKNAESDESLARLFDLMMTTKDLFLFRKCVIEVINDILKAAEEKNNTKIIRYLSDAVISLVENAVREKYDDEFIKGLQACLGDIHMCLYA